MIGALASLLFYWSTKLVAFFLVGLILTFVGTVLFVYVVFQAGLPIVVLVVLVCVGKWLLSTPFGLRLRQYLARAFEEYYPLPPGNYVNPPGDYGLRLGAQWNRLSSITPTSPLSNRRSVHLHAPISSSVPDDTFDFPPILSKRSTRASREHLFQDDTEVYPTKEQLSSISQSPPPSEWTDDDDVLAHQSDIYSNGSQPRSKSFTVKTRSKDTSDSGSSGVERSEEVPQDNEGSGRKGSSPIQITSPSKVSKKRHVTNGNGNNHAQPIKQDSSPFILTDGALVELSVLGSTPASHTPVLLSNSIRGS